jgi:hypothetical protein
MAAKVIIFIGLKNIVNKLVVDAGIFLLKNLRQPPVVGGDDVGMISF